MPADIIILPIQPTLNLSNRDDSLLVLSLIEPTLKLKKRQRRQRVVHFEPIPADALIEILPIKPTLVLRMKPKAAIVKPQKSIKSTKRGMNKKMREFVEDTAVRDAHAASRAKKKAKPVVVMHGDDDDEGGEDVNMEPITGTGGQIQTVRITNAAYMNASRILMRKINEVVGELKKIKENKYDAPLERMAELHHRIKWNAEREIYDKDDEIRMEISKCIIIIMDPNELPSRKTGDNLEQAWYSLKYEIASSIIGKRPPSDRMIHSSLHAMHTKAAAEPANEVLPTNAIDFSQRASDILGERIDALNKCMREIHEFTVTISPHLVIPSFSHHVVFAY